MVMEPTTGNYTALIELPEEASLVVHEVNPLDDENATVVISVAEIVGSFDTDDEDPDDDYTPSPETGQFDAAAPA